MNREQLLNLLCEVSRLYPDMRLGQIIEHARRLSQGANIRSSVYGLNDTELEAGLRALKLRMELGR